MSGSKSVTAEAASNIAFIKYWGAVDLERVLPTNPSISMTLSACRSICSATFHEGATGADEILLVENGVAAPAPESFRGRIQQHLDRLRSGFGRRGRMRIATRNTFPAAAGIASSASGFAALTLAVSRALGVALDGREHSIWSRRSGSGSAARSAFGGFVEWPAGEGEDEAYAVELASSSSFPLSDVIAIVQRDAKKVSSLDGHKLAQSSPHFARRLQVLPERLEIVRQGIAARDFEALGATVEEEAIELHLIAMSSKPPIFYWHPTTLAVLQEVRALRERGVPAFSTMDAGANVHVLCEPSSAATVAATLQDMDGVQEVLRDHGGDGPVWREGADL